MKKILIVLSTLMFTGFLYTGCQKNKDKVENNSQAPVQQTEGPFTDWLIHPKIGIGEIRFGMAAQQMKDILGEPSTKTGVSYIYTSLGLEIVARDNKLTYIYCGNPNRKDSTMFKAMEEACKFKTAAGIGIGSTKVQVMEAFGQPTKRKDNQLLYIEERICFFMDDNKVIGIWLRE